MQIEDNSSWGMQFLSTDFPVPMETRLRKFTQGFIVIYFYSIWNVLGL